MNELAFIFPGQGSQKLGMLAEFSAYQSVIDTYFERANDALGFDLYNIARNGPEDQLNDTANTQPILLTLSCALWEVYCDHDQSMPSFLAGHSLGEYSALVAAESLNFEDAVKLVHLRGQLMQAAVPPGHGLMAAIIALSDEEVNAVCASVDGEVSAANFNSPGQVVIAGEKAAVEKACELAKEKGARMAKVLPVSIPSHCALMKPAAEELGAALDQIVVQMPVIPVVHNVSVEVASSIESIKIALVEQLYSPVRWTEIMIYLSEQGMTEFVECGPQKVLCGLGKRIVNGASFKPFSSLIIE